MKNSQKKQNTIHHKGTKDTKNTNSCARRQRLNVHGFP